jgi:hydrogenase/urease accessory protein HupE
MIRGGLVLLAALALATPAIAHPVPFSYLDVSLRPDALDVTLVVHVADVGHELQVDPADRVLNPETLSAYRDAIARLIDGRLTIMANGRKLSPERWDIAEPLPERQSIRLRTRYPLAGAPAVVGVLADLFPYDPPHQTFVNFYEDGAIEAQAVLDHVRTWVEFFPGTTQGALAVVLRFVPAGIRHIVFGADHLLFLLGLLVLGGTIRQLALIVTAFTVANSAALVLAVMNIILPPARVIEPAIALSLVYVGADNLLVHGGRDVRAWIALAFGIIHGFGFAGTFRALDLSRRSLGWSLFSFNVGVEVGQLMVVLALGFALAALRSRSEWAGRQVTVAGSVLVMAAGTFWFIERVFFPGGIS